jgi:hypothetical protein
VNEAATPRAATVAVPGATRSFEVLEPRRAPELRCRSPDAEDDRSRSSALGAAPHRGADSASGASYRRRA